VRAGYEAAPAVNHTDPAIGRGFFDAFERNQIETSRGLLLESISIVWVAIVNEVVSSEWIDAASRFANS
jgi:hypothetical protein